jgi:hypothetical protein
MLGAARAAGGEGHRFAVLQLPFNLLESEAALGPGGVEAAHGGEDASSPDSPPARSVLELAARSGVAVLGNRPLNAFAAGRVVRLADVVPPEADGSGVPGAGVDAGPLAGLEAEFRREIAPAVRVTRGSVPPSELFRWAERITELAGRVDSLERWSRLEQEAILPQVGHVVAALDRGLSGPAAERWEGWRERYLAELEALLDRARAVAAARSRAELARVAAVLDPLLPGDRRPEPLARKALWLAAGTPGVSAVLNGMRRAEYVRDALDVLSWPPPSGVREVLEAVARAAPVVARREERP